MAGKAAQNDGSSYPEELAELQGENENLREAQAATAGGISQLTDRLLKLKLVTPAEVKAQDFDVFDAAATALAETVAERNGLKRSLTAQKAATTRIKGEFEKLEVADKPRALGPIEDQLDKADLAELLADTDRVEIAFSDGRKELAGVPPVAVSGDSFTYKRRRLMLDVPDLPVRGPLDERGVRSLAGFALLIEGEQVAWLPRLAGPVVLGAGKTYQFKDDVSLV